MTSQSPSDEFDVARERLVKFISDLEQLMGWMVEYRHRFMPRDIADQLRPAWEELQALFEEAKSEIGDAEPEQLRRRGLTGSQLALKLDAFERERLSFERRYKRTVEEGNLFLRSFLRLPGTSFLRAGDR